MPVTITEPEIEEEINIEPVIERYQSTLSCGNTLNVPKNILLRCKINKKCNTVTFTPQIEKNQIKVYVDFHSSEQKSRNTDIATWLTPINTPVIKPYRGIKITVRTVIRYFLQITEGDKVEWKFKIIEGKPRMYIEKV